MEITLKKQDSTYLLTGRFTDIEEMNLRGSIFERHAASLLTCHDTGGYYGSPFCSSEIIVFTLKNISTEMRLQNLRTVIQSLSAEFEADFQDLTR